MLKNVGISYDDKGSELSRLQGGVHGATGPLLYRGSGAVRFGSSFGLYCRSVGLVTMAKWGFPGSCRRYVVAT